MFPVKEVVELHGQSVRWHFVFVQPERHQIVEPDSHVALVTASSGDKPQPVRPINQTWIEETNLWGFELSEIKEPAWPRCLLRDGRPDAGVRDG